MGRPKGSERTPGSGRRRGTTNKLTGRNLLESSILLGRITAVQPRTAQVSLLANPSNPPISVRLDRRLPGSTLLQPQAISDILHIQPSADGFLIAKNVPNEQLAKKDEFSDVLSSLVITDEAGGLPAGLAIGRVTKQKLSTSNMLFSDLTIEPFFRTTRFSRVMVLRPNRPGN